MSLSIQVRKILRGVAALRAREISDEYIKWLGYANVGMLVPGNVYCFDYAIRNLPSIDPIIEIGSFCGLSANALTYFKAKYGIQNRLVTCDKWEFGSFVGNAPICNLPAKDYDNFIKETFKRNVQTFSGNDLPYSIEMYSDEFFAAWGEGAFAQDVFGREIQLGGQISFAYIDGNHDYEYAHRDFNNCDRYLVPGGFLLFDDSGDFSEWESRWVAREAVKTGGYDLVIKNPNYLLRKKGGPDLPSK
jgi:hypothetical protein